MNLSQRRRLMGMVLAVIVLVTAIISLAARGSGTPPPDRASMVAWFEASGRQASLAAASGFDQLLSGLSHSKVDNGGSGIVQDEGICKAGAASIRAYSPHPPPGGALRTAYVHVMSTGSAVFTHCLRGIALASTPATSKHDVNLMLAEMSSYSTVIASYEDALRQAGL